MPSTTLYPNNLQQFSSRSDISWHVWFIRHSKQFMQLFESQSSMLPNIQRICFVDSLISFTHTGFYLANLLLCTYIYMFQLKKISTTKWQHVFFISLLSSNK